MGRYRRHLMAGCLASIELSDGLVMEDNDLGGFMRWGWMILTVVARI